MRLVIGLGGGGRRIGRVEVAEVLGPAGLVVGALGDLLVRKLGLHPHDDAVSRQGGGRDEQGAKGH